METNLIKTIDPDDIFIDNIHLFFGKTYKLNLVKETFDTEGYYLEDTLKFKTIKTEEEKEAHLLKIGNDILEDVFKTIKIKLKLEEEEINKITENLKIVNFDDRTINDIIKEKTPSKFYSTFLINYFEKNYKLGEIGKILFNETNYKQSIKNNFTVIDVGLFNKISSNNLEKIIENIKIIKNNNSTNKPIDIFENIYNLKIKDTNNNGYYDKLDILFTILFKIYNEHETRVNETNINENIKILNKIYYVNSIFIYIYTFLVSDNMNDNMINKTKQIDDFLNVIKQNNFEEYSTNYKDINENLLDLINTSLKKNVNLKLNELYNNSIEEIKNEIFTAFNIGYINYDEEKIKEFYKKINKILNNDCNKNKNYENYEKIVIIYNIISFILKYLNVNIDVINIENDKNKNNEINTLMSTSLNGIKNDDDKKKYIKKIIKDKILDNNKIAKCFEILTPGGGLSLDSLKEEIRMKIGAIKPKLYY